jgi:transcription termination/antitermination protein NusG
MFVASRTSKTNMAKQTQHHGRAWYVIHTYSGYEDNVARNLKQRIESMDMQDLIFDVMVPIEKKIKIKSGKRTVIEEKIYPGYVLVEMIVTDASWYVVRNTPNVTGFIGLGTTPTPVDPAEIEMLKKRMGVAEPKYKIDVAVGDSIKIIDGPFKDFDAKVDEVDEAKGRLKVLVSIFGRETPVELDFLQIHKL